MCLIFLIFACGITTSLQYSGSLSNHLNPSWSEKDIFLCHNNHSIPINQRCNKKFDCLDKSDEYECDHYHCLPSKYFKCKDGNCIQSAYVCDGVAECNDNSDEENCSQHLRNCTKNEWQCGNKQCIPEDWVCNTIIDCLDGSDETRGCHENHKCDEFKCKHGECIPNSFICDGHKDCSGGEDEEACETHIDPSMCTLDARRYLCANNNTCLHLHQLCDGKRNCPDGSDESTMCKLHTCTNSTCSHECAIFPDGLKCLCPAGYHQISEKICKDINECENYGICDQKCINVEGSYKCDCDAKYKLQDDKKTCRVSGGEAILVYSSEREIHQYFLESHTSIQVATDLHNAAGVAFDGRHIYWTELADEHETITRALEDGSNKQHIVTSGLGRPEVLAVDWVTGNIYFSDYEMKHIAVCNKNGNICAVLVSKDLQKPRGIAVSPSDGEMYWSDWGDHRPEIVKALMDGTGSFSFVSTNIAWPNGITIDNPNQRLYWTDAKVSTLESIKLDGTDRRVVLSGIVKHPFFIAVFEDKLFWSDRVTCSINSCNKFTGKNHTVLVRGSSNDLFGIQIYHSAMKSKRVNPCKTAWCSDICLLSGGSYSCACPPNKYLGPNKHTCLTREKKQMLIAGTKHYLIQIEHQLLGKHNVIELPTTATMIVALAYSSLNNTLYIGDEKTQSIIALNLDSRVSKTIYQLKHPSIISALAYDYLGHNLFYCDSGMRTINVLSLNTMKMKPLLHDFGGEEPKSIAVIPEKGIMFVAFQKENNREDWHIDRFSMDGTGRTHTVDTNLQGPITVYYDHDVDKLFWTDPFRGFIESINITGHGRKIVLVSPDFALGISSLSTDLFWTNGGKAELMWMNKFKKDFPKKLILDLPGQSVNVLSLVAVTPKEHHPHPCQVNNGNCSHICLAVHNVSLQCLCPIGMHLRKDQITCWKPAQCTSQEFYCKEDDKCIPLSMYCNSRKDCDSGEDEIDCNKKYSCVMGYFQCHDGDCIRNENVCDGRFQCNDHSDEEHCNGAKKRHHCLEHEYMCSNGICIDKAYICDEHEDCAGGEDEQHCINLSCDTKSFRCGTGRCIRKEFECDGEPDCGDLSDEHIGCNRTTCAPDMFTCRNGVCISSKLKCDKNDDCGDGSDEVGCATADGTCRVGEFQCVSDPSICYPSSNRCDGKPDCPHKEDESFCSHCHVDQFECQNNKCTDRSWICDGADDCGDNSDENNDLCTHNGSAVSVKDWLPCKNGFRCKNGNCVDYEFVCDKNNDCDDGSDEADSCETSCLIDTNPCSQKCQKTPNGPVCFCNKGYQLTGDGKSCQDIKECKIYPPVCSQTCRELEGSFMCGCYDGFSLRNDKKSCKSDGDSMSIIFVKDREIRRLSPSENQLNVVFDEDVNQIVGLTASVEKGYIYFGNNVDTDHGYMTRMSVNSKKVDKIRKTATIDVLAIDWLTENIYYVTEEDRKYMAVCHFESPKCYKLFPMILDEMVTDIVIDPINKFIFYVEVRYTFTSPLLSQIMKKSLTGEYHREGPDIVMYLKDTHITGLALDINTQTVYYSDKTTGVINSTGYFGGKPNTVFKDRTKPHGLRMFEDSLYFIENRNYMTKCKLYDTKACETFRLEDTWEFIIYQQSTQPKGVNVCTNHSCNTICLPATNGPICICSNPEELNCIQPIFKEDTGLEDHTLPPFYKDTAKVVNEGLSGWDVFGIVFGVLSIIAIIGGIALYFIQNSNGRIDFISMRFMNPMFGSRRASSPTAEIIQPSESPENLFAEVPTVSARLGREAEEAALFEI